MKHILILLCLLSSVFSDDTFDLENDFLTSLEEVSEIATKSKLNIDDTPSFVTVLSSNKLKKLGVDTVFEALGLVPGVQLKKEATGVPVVVFRGVSQKSEVKLMIDGVAINNSYRGSIYYYLDFPIEMVERIEIIRGAGSVLYGSGAISGVVNVITHTSEKVLHNKAFISSGTYNSNKGGANISTKIADTSIAIDGYYQKSDKKIFVDTNPSGYSGDSDRHLKDYSIGMKLSNGNFSFLNRLKKSDIGNAYGLFGVLDTDNNKFRNVNTSLFSQLSYKDNINKENKITILAGYTNYNQEISSIHKTQGEIDSFFEEDTYYGEINLISTSIKDNKLLTGAKYETSKTGKSEWLHTSIVLPQYISDPDLSRDIISIYINDIYSVSSNLDMSAGLRHDHYSDFGSSYSPNLGMVYRLNDKIRIKALYSHAYRAPSWIELTSNNNLDAEHSNSLEAGLVFKNNLQNSFKINFYTTKIEDMIVKDSTGTYTQNSLNKFYGSELEYIYSPNSKTELSIFGTYIKAVDEYGNRLPDIANFLTSASLTYELNSAFTFGSLLKYVSSSKRSDTDTRDEMKQSLIFNQTLSYTFKEFTASLIIKDLFDAGTKYALPNNDYSKDFDDGGRTFLLKASMEF